MIEVIGGTLKLSFGSTLFSYIAVQIPESMMALWSWREWGYDPESGQIVNAEDSTELIPFNCTSAEDLKQTQCFSMTGS